LAFPGLHPVPAASSLFGEPLMQSSFGLARGVLRMVTVMGWLMIVGAMAAMVLTWGNNDVAVLSMALVLLVYGVVMTFVSEMATAQLRTAENTAMLVADMQSLMEKIGTQPNIPMESLGDFQERAGRARE
jgi:uncharacterized membrane protein YqhA